MLFNEEIVDSCKRDGKVDIIIRSNTYISAQKYPNCVYIAYFFSYST
jgi:hypothetical protein